jgi:hypothetical protein
MNRVIDSHWTYKAIRDPAKALPASLHPSGEEP